MPGRWPGGDGPITYAKRRVGYHARLRHLVHVAQAMTRRTYPLWRVWRKVLCVQHRLMGGIGAGTRVHHAYETGQRGHTAYGRARIARPTLLLQCDRWRQAVDRIDIRNACLVDQSPRIGGNRLEVAPLRLGIDRAEGKRGLAGTRHTGKHHERIAWNGDIDVFEVVFPRAAHFHQAAGRSVAGGFTE